VFFFYRFGAAGGGLSLGMGVSPIADSHEFPEREAPVPGSMIEPWLLGCRINNSIWVDKSKVLP